MVSMVPYGAADDFTSFYLLTSELAPHTQDMLREKNVSLMISETDDDRDDPLTLARVVIRGQAERLPMGEPGYMPAKELYVRRSGAGATFEFGDLGRGASRQGRALVAGFASINLTTDAMRTGIRPEEGDRVRTPGTGKAQNAQKTSPRSQGGFTMGRGNFSAHILSSRILARLYTPGPASPTALASRCPGRKQHPPGC
jgi:hypothetical protein